MSGSITRKYRDVLLEPHLRKLPQSPRRLYCCVLRRLHRPRIQCCSKEGGICAWKRLSILKWSEQRTTGGIGLQQVQSAILSVRVREPSSHRLVDVEHVDIGVPGKRVQRRAVGVAVDVTREAGHRVEGRITRSTAEVYRSWCTFGIVAGLCPYVSDFS